MLENRSIIAAISCNKDVLGSLRGCVLVFEWKSHNKWNCAIACISVHFNVMYFINNEHSLSNLQTEKKVKECLDSSNASFKYSNDERSNVD